MRLIKITHNALIVFLITVRFTLSIHLENKFLLKKNEDPSDLGNQPTINPTKNTNDSNNNYKYYNENSDSKVLLIEVLVECLCPFSVKFIKNSFAQFARTKDSSQLAEVKIYPFGNGIEKYNKETKRYEYECQHGSKECYGNSIQICAIELMKSREDANEFLICSYSNIAQHKKDFDTNLKFCLDELKYPPEYEEKIRKCTMNEDGNMLMHRVANRYNQNEYVPWVIVNGKFNERSGNRVMTNMLEYACENSNADQETKKRICKNVAGRVEEGATEEIGSENRTLNPFFHKKTCPL